MRFFLAVFSRIALPDEMRSRGFCVDSYDTVVQILGSDWKSRLASEEPSGLARSVVSANHFALFISNSGYLEVMAESCKEVNGVEANDLG